MTRIGVQAAPGRARLDLAAGPISPRVISCTATGARVALVATTALLLGGDHVEIDIEVGPGAWLEIVEIAGTVAYDADGVASSWTVRARVADGGVTDLGGRAVRDRRRGQHLAQHGDRPGRRRGGVPPGNPGAGPDRGSRGSRADPGSPSPRPASRCWWRTSTCANPAPGRCPGILGPARVIDTVALFGARAPADPAPPVGHRFELDRPGSVARALTSQVDRSPLAEVAGAWQAFASRAAAAPAPVDSATNRPSS